MPNYIPGSGDPNAKLMIVGEAPGKSEDSQGIPFCGASGEVVWAMLEKHHIYREQIWTTNVYKYRPPNNNILRIGEVCNPLEEQEKLWNEIRAINPNCILAFGGTALQVLTERKGIKKWRGSILSSARGQFKVVSTIHPANIVRSQAEFDGGDYTVYAYIWKSIVELDINRAIEQSKFPEDRMVRPVVSVCKDIVQFVRFIEQNKHLPRMAIDIESYNCVPSMVGITFDGLEALVVPLFRKMGKVVLSSMTSSDMINIWIEFNKLLKEKLLIGQNIKYDQQKLEMLGFGFRKERPIYSDTMIKAHVINPELPSKKMEMLQSIWTDMPFHKDEGKEFDYVKGKLDRLFHYCGLDVCSSYRTDDTMDEDIAEMSSIYGTDVRAYYEYRMSLHEVYMDIERIGFRLDTVAKSALKVKYENRHDFIQARFSEHVNEFIIGGIKCHDNHLVNVAAPGQMKKLVYDYLKLPIRTMRGKIKLDEDTIVAIINNNIKKTSDEWKKFVLLDILEDRKTRKTLGTYVNAKPDYDGRMRCSYRLTGTETGRTSTSILKPPLRPFKSGHAFQTLTKHGEIGPEIRTVYICDPGFVLVNIDLSQAEPRIVAVLSNDIPLQEAFKNGKVDIHRRTAALVTGNMSILDLSDRFIVGVDDIPKDGPIRFLGKTCRNGGNYDMGKGTLSINIATDAKKSNLDITVSEWRANKMLEAFHAASPNIRGIFHKEIQNAIDTTGILINPFGKPRKFFGRLEPATYKEGYAEIPQSTVADKVKHSILDVRNEMPDFGKMLMGESHDALTMRFPINEWEDRARIVVKHMSSPIDFSCCTLKRGMLSIPVDVEMSGTNYSELRKVKL